MTYLWLKVFHICAVIFWIAGILATGAVVASNVAVPGRLEEGCRFDIVNEMLRWDRRVTLPAMIFSWSFGLALAVTGGWFPAKWLLAKLICVALMSALHGTLSGMLRRLRSQAVFVKSSVLRFASAATVGVLVTIVSLVIIKPFGS